MFHRFQLCFCVLVASIGFALGPLALRAQDEHRGRKYKTPPPASHIEVTVLKDFNGKPILNAHVIFHPTEGDKDKGSLEVKTDEDGKAVIDVIPIGDTVTLQVIADGYQTYGQSYKIDKSDMTMKIRMKRPGAQYSLYKSSGSDSGSGAGSGANSSAGSESGSSSSSGGSSNAKQPQPPPK